MVLLSAYQDVSFRRKMELGINLLKKPTGLTQSQYELEEKLLRSSVVVFLVIVVISIALFAWQLITTAQLNNTKREIETTERQLVGLKDASDKQLYIKKRLELIGEFLNSRVNTREAIQQVFSIDVDGVTISSASFEDEKTITMTVSAVNVLALDEVYAYFEQRDLFFPQIINRGVSRTDEGDYTMTLELTIPFEG